MGTLIDSETQAAKNPTGIKALVPPNLDLTQCISQDQLGCATVTNNPQVSVLWHNKILFLNHEICPLLVNRSSASHIHSGTQAAAMDMLSTEPWRQETRMGQKEHWLRKPLSGSNTHHICSYFSGQRVQGSAIDALLPCAWREKQTHLANSTNN